VRLFLSAAPLGRAIVSKLDSKSKEATIASNNNAMPWWMHTERAELFFGAQTVMTLLLTRTIEIEMPKVFSVKCF
jgi:hypothetical protein